MDKSELISHIKSLQDGNLSKRKCKEARPFDISKYETVLVAFKVAYFGANYRGFASQQSINGSDSVVDHVSTVEDHLFSALLRTRLVPGDRVSTATCEYSRCGRTDAGVSAVGQVIACRVRTWLKDAPLSKQEYPPYLAMLNGNLPHDIRILDWAPVKTEACKEPFSARFNCLWREYRYYFPAAPHLNVEAMQEAASYLLGEHDFEWLCRRDASKVITNYNRCILEARIEPVDDTWNMFICRGTAFLYHQVRCIMGALFMIGHGTIPPATMKLLARPPEDHTKKSQDAASKDDSESHPFFPIASEKPLVLHRCGFSKEMLTFPSDENSSMNDQLASHLYSRWRDYSIEGLIARSAFDSKFSGESTLNAGRNPVIDGIQSGLSPSQKAFIVKRNC